MRVQKDWDSLSQVFKAIHACSDALVLRNYEELSDDTYCLAGHDDIDLLCDAPAKIIRALDARRNVYWGSPDHVIVSIRGMAVKLGLRYPGDGYFDGRWERAMLARKRRYAGWFFVPAEEDCFYSLLYHAMLQKDRLSAEYRLRLLRMGSSLGLALGDERDFPECLFAFLRENGYHVEYPRDVTVPIHFDAVPKDLLGSSLRWRMGRLLFQPRRMLHKVSVRIS